VVVVSGKSSPTTLDMVLLLSVKEDGIVIVISGESSSRETVTLDVGPSSVDEDNVVIARTPNIKCGRVTAS
jgi:hypothetical protein